MSTVHGVCLPGRESRFKESFIIDDWESFLSDFCEDVLEILKGKPFAFWGSQVCETLNLLLTKEMNIKAIFAVMNTTST